MVLVVHGYHPLADDGAVYVAGIKKLANPGLYPSDAVFALAPTHVSIFAHVLAAILRATHLALPVLLLLCHLASIVLFLEGCQKVARRLFLSTQAQWGAVLLAACCFTLPIAGTSLDIMDPYVTARSFSTPLSLFALAYVLNRQWLPAAVCLTGIALLHPLMAAYAAILLVCVALAQRRHWLFLALLCCLAWTLAGAIFLFNHASQPLDLYDQAALSRSYFFLSRWQWFEYLGLAIPLLLLAYASLRARLTAHAQALTIAATTVCACALLTSLCFVHQDGSLWLARLQILRTFQWVYLTGVLLGGGLLGSLSKRRRPFVLAAYVLAAAALCTGQYFTYPASSHVEWPGRESANPWQRAFAWIREHSPQDALFALDNDYIEAPGEDAQGFRATAERSSLADYFKDGGIAANFRQAAGPWGQGSQATQRLNQATDAEREARLLPLHVGWVVLPAAAMTHLDCPYLNAAVRICRLWPLLHRADGAK